MKVNCIFPNYKHEKMASVHYQNRLLKLLTNLKPHLFRAIMMEFRRNQEIEENIREFSEDFELFEYDDIVQYDTDQENHMILAILQDQADEHI
ncbi:hypothetical protein [Bacillus sp. BP-3]|uniref:hypothetical protein n=1 Tax=Bacillus sp. BP-3 TaxID=3022773 RepID=UPI00232E9E34|nr:hypothetical protein [Bacillus sp. BP-3]